MNKPMRKTMKEFFPSTYLWLLDPGHGGMIQGEYQTDGKMSPKWDDGTQLFEGVYNRNIVKKIGEELEKLGIDYVNLIPEESDIKLKERMKRSLTMARLTKKKVIYLSIHGNAEDMSKKGWGKANGIEVFVNNKESEHFAIYFYESLEKLGLRMRTYTPKNKIKYANFYVLRNNKLRKEVNGKMQSSIIPAILTENGFYTNREECRKMLTDEFQTEVAMAHVNAIKEIESLTKY